MNRVVSEIHVAPALVNSRHQTLLVCCRPVDGVEVRIVDSVVVRLAARAVEFKRTTVSVGDRYPVNKCVSATVEASHPAVVFRFTSNA